jgi:tripartite-type tricarboxylate transporter receptor subunit TctC
MRVVLAALLANLFALAPALAQDAGDYPDRPIKLIVPFDPGGGGDLVSKAFVEEFSKILGQPVVAENHGGASAIIGTDLLAKAEPDGYTIAIVNPLFVTNPALRASLPYDPLKSFAFVGRFISYPLVLGVRADLPVRSVAELIDYARSHPGELTNATSGVGSGQHLAIAQLSALTGIEVKHVPYKGAGPSLTALGGGHVDMTSVGLSLLMPLVQDDRVRLIGTTGTRPLSDPPVPPVADTVPGYDYTLWWAMIAPAGTPQPILDELNAALRQAFADPAVAPRLASLEGEIAVGSPAEFASFAESEIRKWKDVVVATGIEIQQ